MWDDVLISEFWAIVEKKRWSEGRYNTSSPISLSNTFYTKSDKKITFFIQFSSYFPCQMNWMRNTSRQSIVAMLLLCIYTYCIKRILKIFKQAGNSCIWMLLFLKWFFSWVSQSFHFQAQILCDSFICIFPPVFIG